MTADRTTIALGWRVYGLGAMALAMVALAFGDFLPDQPVPKGFPGRTALAYAAGAFMLVASAAALSRRTVAWGAAALTAYYALIVVILMDGRVVLAHYREFIAYSNAAEQLAIAAGGLIVYAASAKIEAALAARLIRLGQLAFGVCAVLFGGAHFAYLNFTAPLVTTTLVEPSAAALVPEIVPTVTPAGSLISVPTLKSAPTVAEVGAAAVSALG